MSMSDEEEVRHDKEVRHDSESSGDDSPPDASPVVEDDLVNEEADKKSEEKVDRVHTSIN